MKMRPTLCLLAVFLPLAAAAAEPIGEVSASRGNAFLSRQEVNEVAAKGVPVLLDDTALTGDEFAP